ncbi:hypothetical protein [Nocardia cyriacigeorgica]|uniref:hypothetical protein n=1 Tax=Nocardia cyriacigeorgica TaxID=135487 RepID=UPI0024556FE0|nr:hypothetical protein [Nocardia cyriacigeorgica]
MHADRNGDPGLTADQIVRAIQDNPHYTPGTPVRIAGCHLANNPDLAQDIANRLNAPVTVATDAVGVPNKPDSPAHIRNNGHWVTHHPTTPTGETPTPTRHEPSTTPPSHPDQPTDYMESDDPSDQDSPPPDDPTSRDDSPDSDRPSNLDHGLDQNRPQRQTTWDPPDRSESDQRRVVLRPGQRLIDYLEGDLESGVQYNVYEIGPDGEVPSEPRSRVYTDDGNPASISHIDGAVSNQRTYTEDWTDSVQSSLNPDFSFGPGDPISPNTVVRADTGDGEFVHQLGEDGLPRRAIDTTTPTGYREQTVTHSIRNGPFSLTNLGADTPSGLERNTRYVVRDRNGNWHGTFWTDETGEVRRIKTWSGSATPGRWTNPDLGNKEEHLAPDSVAEDGKPVRSRVPRPNAVVEVVGPVRDENGRLIRPDEDAATRWVYATDENGDSLAAEDLDHRKAADDERVRNPKFQGFANSVGAEEYGPELFDGGHTFRDEAGAPPELVNYTPQWYHENQGRSPRENTWYQMEDDLLERVANQGATLTGPEIFHERTSNHRTPDLVHARWTEERQMTVLVGDPPREEVRTIYEAHYRTFPNVPPQHRPASPQPPAPPTP